MSKLFNWAAARIVAAFALTLPLAAMAVITKDYEDFGDTDGVVLWRGIEANFHASTVVDVAMDGTPGTNYQMTADNTATSWQRFARGQSAYTSPGKVLVYCQLQSMALSIVKQIGTDHIQLHIAKCLPSVRGGCIILKRAVTNQLSIETAVTAMIYFLIENAIL